MADERNYEEVDDDGTRRATGRESMRRRSIANTESRSRKRKAPTKFNGIHRRKSKRVAW